MNIIQVKNIKVSSVYCYIKGKLKYLQNKPIFKFNNKNDTMYKTKL